MSEGTRKERIEEDESVVFMLRRSMKWFRSFSQKWIAKTAERLSSLPDKSEIINRVLADWEISEDDPDREAWGICALYFISASLFAMEYAEEADKTEELGQFTESILTNAVPHPAFIWSRIKHLYPDVQDGTDIINPRGEAFMEKIIDMLIHFQFLPTKNGNSADVAKKEYRTRKKAGSIIPLPSYLATITLPNWEYGVSLLSDGNAHLEPIQAFVADRLQFEDGVLYFENSNGQKEEFTEAHLRKGMTKEGIDKINLPLLRFYYSTILKCLETNLRDLRRKGNNNDEAIRQTLTFMPVTLYLPELIERLDGGKGNFNQEKAMKLIKETSAFRHIIGVIYDYKGRESYYPVLNFRGYNVANNTISFESPYLSYLAIEIYDNSAKRNKGGKPIAKKNGAPALLPSHSYLIKPSIAAERNKDAALNAMNIVTLIEQAGGKDAHISAVELIRRNPVFEERLQRSANKRQLLSRTFKKTWELLRSQTRLEEVYKDISLPSPYDAASIPTQSSMESLVFTFTHKGKSKS